MAQVKQRGKDSENVKSRNNKTDGARRNNGAKNSGLGRGGVRKTDDIYEEDELHTRAEVSKEFIIWCTLIVSVILFLCVFGLCGPLNNVFGALVFGIFGTMAYIFPFLLFFSTGIYFMNRTSRYIVKRIIFSWLFYIDLAALIQMLVNDKVSNVFQCYRLGYETHFGGGFIGGCISLGLTAVMGTLAASLMLIIIAVMLFVFITGKFIASIVLDRSVDRYNEYMADRKEINDIRRKREEQAREERREERRKKRRKSYIFPDDGSETPYINGGQEKTNLPGSVIDGYLPEKEADYEEEGSGNDDSGNERDTVIEEDGTRRNDADTESADVNGDSLKIKRAVSIDELPIYEKELITKFGSGSGTDSDALGNLIERAYDDVKITDNADDGGYDKMDGISISNMYSDSDGAESCAGISKDITGIETDVPDTSGDVTDDNEGYYDNTGSNINLSGGGTDTSGDTVRDEAVSDAETDKNRGNGAQSVRNDADTSNDSDAESGEVDIELPPEPIPYIFPSLELLSKPSKNSVVMSDKTLKETAGKLQECLRSFKVEVTMKEIICGPTVTRYELQPALGTRVKKITELENDIKLYLAAKDLRIEAPIPGKSAVGIEVPNNDNVTITIREMLETPEFTNHKSNISFAVGKDIGGRNVVADIQKMPHLLIAGSTGSGKSVCINTIVMSLIYKADPNDVKLIMIDPKVVELSIYNCLPHLCIPVVTDPKRAAAALHWAVVEMDERYEKFADFGVRDLTGFNMKLETVTDNPNMYRKMPQIVIIVDELADLMMVASHEVENSICRLAQKARACGIHLIIATQRPSVDVITGLIKANIPSRIAFAVSSQIDSRTILDGTGAEKLLGKGDMLFFPQGLPKPIRVQGAFVSDSEVARVTDFIRTQYDMPVYDSSIDEKINDVQFSANETASSAATLADTDENGRDDLFEEAARFIIEKQKASIGTLQRVFKIGFNRGARIMDQLSEAGVVSEEDGKKPRNILMTMEEFEQMIQEGR